MLDAAIIGARFLQFISTIVLFGSSLFIVSGLNPPPRDGAWHGALLFWAGIAALLSGGGMIMLQAVSLGGDVQDAIDPAFLKLMLTETGFGKVFALRFVLIAMSLAAILLLARSEWKRLAYVQIFLGGILLASFAWTGHGAKDDGLAGTIHAASDVLHLLAAGVWIGALFPLAILLKRSVDGASDPDIEATREGLVWFSGIGVAVVAVLVLSGILNSWFLVGPSHLTGLFTTLYGLVLLIKLALFGGMLVLAAANRYRLVPDLESDLAKRAPPGASLAALKRSVFAETLLAILVLIAVGLLGTLEPPVSLV